MYLFNPTYYLFALPALLLGLWAQARVRSAYNKYSRVANRSGSNGYQAARRLLSAAGLDNVEVSETRGSLTDHYDPRKKRLYLSSGVAQNASVASLGIVAHEVGHAMQDAEAYVPLKLRGAIVPAVQIGSWLGQILFMVGLIFQLQTVPVIGLVLFSATLIFALVTLPVEFDASRRAVAMLGSAGLASPMEEKSVKKVLDAAALTYIAAAIQALSTILYYVFLLSGRRRR